MDPAAINASTDLVKLLGRDQARMLLTILELPDEERMAFISSVYHQEDAQAHAEYWPTRRKTSPGGPGSV
jgi:hypothetical protein